MNGIYFESLCSDLHILREGSMVLWKVGSMSRSDVGSSGLVQLAVACKKQVMHKSATSRLSLRSKI